MNWVNELSCTLRESQGFLNVENQQNTKMLKKFITSSSLIIIDNDLVRVYINADAKFDEDSVKENIEVVMRELGDSTFYQVVVPDPTAHISISASDFHHSAFDELKKGEALVIQSLGHRILAQAYLRVTSRKFPVRVFNKEEEALAWFEDLRSK
jgi:hypothetical protein